MKPPTVFLGEMTNPEVEAFVRDHDTVLVPIGSTEQHGPHGPLLTDVLVPVEVARRVAPRVGRRRRAIDQLRAVVPARRVHRRRPPADRHVHGGRRGRRGRSWRPWASGGSCSSTATTTTPSRSPTPARTRPQRLPDGARAFPINYWDGMTAGEAGEYFGPTAGLHANTAETSAVMAIDPTLVDIDAANAEMPPFPEVTSPAAVHTAFFFSTPGLGPSSEPLRERGATRASRRPNTASAISQVVTEATLRMLDDVRADVRRRCRRAEPSSPRSAANPVRVVRRCTPRVTRRAGSSSSSTRSAR